MKELVVEQIIDPEILNTLKEYKVIRDVEEVATSKNCVVHRPAANELLIDIDSSLSDNRFHEGLGQLTNLGAIKVDDINDYKSSSKGRHNRHYIVILDHNIESEYERILLQLLLGSDITRETLNYVRAKHNIADPNVLFTPKDELEAKAHLTNNEEYDDLPF